MKFRNGLFLLSLVCLLTANAVFAQTYDRAGITFDWSSAKGSWTPYEHVISDYFKAFPYLTDTGNISRTKRGFSVGVTSVKERLIVGFRVGSVRSMAWADGNSPMGGSWQEIILVKCNTTDLFAGYFFIQKPWFRMGITGAVSYNVMKMKSERTDVRFAKAKEGKFILINPGNARNRENTLFFAVKVGLPIAFGRNHAFCMEPFLAIPLWKINTSEIRDELMPNSTPAHEKNYYRGGIGYGGVRFSLCLGFKNL